MSQARAIQTPEQILVLAKADKWQDIQDMEDAAVNKAVKFKSLSLVEAIINKEFDMALRRAIVSKAPFSLIVLLIARRVNINSVSMKVFNRTSLHFAAQLGMTNVIQALVDAGAYVNMIDEKNFTPAHLACQQGHGQAALLLATLGAYPVGDVSPASLIAAEKRTEFFQYHLASQVLAGQKKLLPSGRGTRFDTLIEQGNAITALSTVKRHNADVESDNSRLEGMLGEGREQSLVKITEICSMRGILVLSVKEYMDLDKVYIDVNPMNLTQMLLRYGNAKNDNKLISCSQNQMTKLINLGFQWAEVEALSETKFNLSFRTAGLDSFFLLSEASDLRCDSRYVRKAQDGKLIIDDKNLSDAIRDLPNCSVQKTLIPDQKRAVKLG